VPGSPIGIIAFRDQLRKESREVIQTLQREGIRHMVMLSGDNETVAGAMAREAGMREWVSGLLPAGKVEAIERLKKEHGGVAMVGDGINDAPALAVATVGIAMGGAGSDTALETADIALMGDNIGKIPRAGAKQSGNADYQAEYRYCPRFEADLSDSEPCSVAHSGWRFCAMAPPCSHSKRLRPLVFAGGRANFPSMVPTLLSGSLPHIGSTQNR
jgi:soluble P-type ATPase